MSSMSTGVPSACHHLGDALLGLRQSLGGPVLERLGARLAAIRLATAANVSGGNVLVSGRPPANEITSGRAVIAIRSRMADDFMTRVRVANSPA